MWFEACEVHKKYPRLIDFSGGLFGSMYDVHKHQVRHIQSSKIRKKIAQIATVQRLKSMLN